MGDLLYLFLWSHSFVLLEYVFKVAAPHIAARSAPDQQVLRRPPHLVPGQAAQVLGRPLRARAQEVQNYGSRGINKVNRPLCTTY